MIPPLTFMLSNRVHENRRITSTARHYALHYAFVFVPLVCSSLSSFADADKPAVPPAQVENNAQQAVSARDFAKAADLYDQAAHAFGEQRDLIKQADCLVESGKLRIELQQYEEAYQRFLQSSELYNKAPDAPRSSIAFTKCQIGRALYFLKGPLEALEELQNLLKQIREQDGLQRETALCLQFIAAIMNERQDYEGALKHAKEGALAATQADAFQEQAGCNIQQFTALRALGRHEEALAAIEKVYNLLQLLQTSSNDVALLLYTMGAIFYELERYTDALEKLTEAYELYKTIPDTQPQQTECLYDISNVLFDLERYTEALKKYDAALKQYRVFPGTEERQADCLESMGIILRRLNRYVDSLEHFEASIELYKKLPGTEKDQAFCLDRMGFVLAMLERYTEALEKYEVSLEQYRKIPGTEKEQADCLENMGIYLCSLNQHAKSLERYETALELYKTIPDTEMKQADCLYAMGKSLSILERCEEAIKMYEAALQLSKAIPGTEEKQADCLYFMGKALVFLGRHEEAIGPYEAALEKFRMIQDKELNQADCLYQMGLSLKYLGRLDAALSKIEAAKLLCNKLEGAERFHAICLLDTGHILSDIGRYEEALQGFIEAYRLFASLEGNEFEQAACIANSGNAYYGLGMFTKALAYYEEANTLFGALDEKKKEQANCIMNLGLVLCDLARYEEALKALKQASTLFAFLEGTEREQAMSIMNLGNAFFGLERYEEALQHYREGYNLFSELKGTELYQANCLLNIGNSFYGLERYEEALGAFKESGCLFAAMDGREREHASCMMNSGLILHSLKRYEEALKAHEDVAGLLASLDGTELLQVKNQNGIGLAYSAIGDWPNALKKGYEGYHGIWKFIIPNLPTLTEEQKITFLSNRLGVPDHVYSVSLLKGKSITDAGRYGLDTLLLSKGLVEYAMQQEQAVFAEKAPLEWQQEYDELQQWRREKATLVHTLNDVMHNPNVKDSPEAQEVRINRAKELETMIVTREQDLAQRNTAFAAEMRIQAVDSGMVSEALARLGTDTALLEYVKYEDWDFIEDTAKETRYGVYVLRAGTNMPVGVDLGPATPIDEAVNKFRASIEQLPSYIGQEGALPDSEIMKEMTTECIAAGNLLRELVFDPVLTHISGCRRLFVAPDAELFLFPFEALPSPEQQQTESRYLVEDYELVYLNTGRELVRFTERHTTSQGNNTAVLVSDPALRMAPMDRAIKTTQWLEANARDTRPATIAGGQTLSDAILEPFLQLNTLGTPNDDKSLGQILETLQQIGGAATFSKNILDLLLQSGHYDVVNLYEQEEALEVRVQSLESPRVLQVLAHGIFLPVEEEKEASPASMFIEGISQGNIQNPLLRSMLALAGASISTAGDIYRIGNRFLTQDEWLALEPDEREANYDIVPLDDGRLTAYEVTGMRLHDTELVALTACNTALGDVGAGASVAGLRRAFITAGAHSMIMAQWEVPERSSLSQMQYFYDTWLDDDKGRYTAFRESQLKMLDSARTDVLGHPWFWAGFVYIGDPGELVDSAIME